MTQPDNTIPSRSIPVAIAVCITIASIITGCGEPNSGPNGAIIDLTETSDATDSWVRRGKPLQPATPSPHDTPVFDPGDTTRLDRLPNQLVSPIGPIGSPVGVTSVSCVTDETGHGAFGRPRVARIFLRPTSGGSDLMNVTRGPMFWIHEGEPDGASPEPTEPMPALRTTVDSSTVTIEATGEMPNGMGTRTFLIELTRQGRFLQGRFTDRIDDLMEVHPVTCWERPYDFNPGFASGQMRLNPSSFDSDSGQCLNADGEESYNVIPIQYIRETGDGECADLRGVQLNGNDFGYPSLEGWNLQGALLDGAELNFAEIKHSLFSGAKMGEMHLGYAKIQGHVSDFTELPVEADCTTDGQEPSLNVVCMR